jgi:plastocyanin
MSKNSFLRVGVVMVALGFSACTSLPTTSRTSTMHEVKVGTKLSPENFSVAPGDEVQWTNMRQEWILIHVPNLYTEDLSCQRGFKNLLSLVWESVRINPNDTVSLCFKHLGIVLYTVRTQTGVGGGRQTFPGSVRVENVPHL